MKVKVCELKGFALNWAVAICERYYYGDAGYGQIALYKGGSPIMYKDQWRPSEDWAQGGPIIERELMCLMNYVTHWSALPNSVKFPHQRGETALVAAMRCFVYSKFGREIDIPDDVLMPNKALTD
jgi:hypothetical protein